MQEQKLKLIIFKDFIIIKRSQNMSNKQELRKQVIHYFRSVGSGENMVQCIKEVLFMHDQFNPVLLFQKISKGRQNITTKSLKNYLISINLHFNERQFKYFMKQNGYKTQTTLNEFLDSLIPYNGDVVRKYKQKCSSSIRIDHLNKQVEYIFIEMIENQLKVCRNLINIRESISALGSLRQIQSLIKTDLLQNLLQNKLIMEHKKLQQKFDNKDFKLGFSELTKFFKIWVPQQITIHELCMLNVMRHLKSNDPFCKIIFTKKSKFNRPNNEQQQRSEQFRDNAVGDVFSNEKLRSKDPSQTKNNQSPYQNQINRSGQRDKYGAFKNQIVNFFNLTSNQHPNSYNINKKVTNDYAREGQSEKKYGRQNIQKRDEFDQRHPNEQSQSRNPRNQGKQLLNYEKHNQERQNRSPEDLFKNLMQGSSKKNDQQSYKKNEKTNQRNETNNQRNDAGNQRNSPSKYVNHNIIRFLEQIVIRQQNLENERKKLAKNNDFNLINLFKLIDYKNKGYIRAKDISEYLEGNKTPCVNMVNFFARQNDRLLFHEFCQIFRPLSRQLNEMLDSRPQNLLPNPFKNDTNQLISDILKTEIQLHNNLERLSQKMKTQNPKAIFKQLDVRGKGYLDSESLEIIFRQNNIPCDDKILKCFMKFLRKKVDDSISFNDFIKFINW